MKIGRNDKCWCGSGKKYKACHMSLITVSKITGTEDMKYQTIL